MFLWCENLRQEGHQARNSKVEYWITRWMLNIKYKINHKGLQRTANEYESLCKTKLQINLCSPVLPYYLTAVPSTRFFRRFVAGEEKNIRREDYYLRELCLVTGLVIDHWTEDRRKTYMSRTSFYDLGTKRNGGQLRSWVTLPSLMSSRNSLFVYAVWTVSTLSLYCYISSV